MRAKRTSVLRGVSLVTSVLVLLGGASSPCRADRGGKLKVGAAAVEIEADDGMVIGGGIHPGRAPDRRASCGPRRWWSRPKMPSVSFRATSSE